MLHPSKFDNPAETIYVAFATEEKVGHYSWRVRWMRDTFRAGLENRS